MNKREGGETRERKCTYIITLAKATKVRHVALSLIRRRRWPATARGGLRDGRRRRLWRGHTRVYGRSDTQTGLRLVSQDSGISHVRRGLLVGKAELQAVRTTRLATVGDVARGAGGGDGHGRLSGVVALRGRGRGAIDDGDAGGLGLLHGFAAHRRCCSRLPMLRWAAHGDGSGGRVRRGLLGGVGVGARSRRRGRRGRGNRCLGRRFPSSGVCGGSGLGRGALSLRLKA